MSHKTQPIQYHLDIHRGSLENEPFTSFYSSSPFMAFNTGDLLDPGTWRNQLDDSPQKPLRILHILHRVWQVKGSHLVHQVSLSVGELECSP